MIRCKNCGAEYEASLRQCPYCQTENEELIAQEHDQALARLDHETRNLVHLPRQIVNRFSSRAARILAVAVIVVLVGGLVTVTARAMGTHFAHQTEPERQEKHLEKLDQLVAARDYEAIWDYLSDHDLYGGTYQEYSDLYFASYPLYYVEECRDHLSRGGLWKSTLGWTLSETAAGILEIDSYLEGAVYVHGVDVVMEEIRADLYALLTVDLGLTDEELQQVFALCEELAEEEDYDVRAARFAEIGLQAAERQGIRILADDEVLE